MTKQKLAELLEAYYEVPESIESDLKYLEKVKDQELRRIFKFMMLKFRMGDVLIDELMGGYTTLFEAGELTCSPWESEDDTSNDGLH